MVTIAAVRSAVVQGADVSFTLTATPVPAAPLTVNVGWEQEGSFLTGLRPTTVTIPITGSASLMASTNEASDDVADGSVSVTVGSSSGYEIGMPASAKVSVALLSTVTITAQSEVVEGADLSITVTASPPPVSSLIVEMVWFDFGGFLGTDRPTAVTISTEGSRTESVPTNDDNSDDPNGILVVQLIAGFFDDYRIGMPDSASVTVKDND